MKVETLNYEGLAEQWKVNLLVRRAVRMGFRDQDLEDAQQEIIADVIAFQFDPARSNGATEVTALTKLIDNRLIHLRRSTARYGKHKDRFQKIAEQAYEPGELNLDDVDVRLAIEKLSAEEQAVCKALGHGFTKNEIQNQLGVGRMKLNRLIRQIHDRFTELGLNDEALK